MSRARPGIDFEGLGQEVLSLLAQGLSNRQMAERLSISVKTAGHHRANLMAKLKLKGAAELARLAIEKGLVD